MSGAEGWVPARGRYKGDGLDEAREPLIYSERSRWESKRFGFKAFFARNSQLLRRFATQKLDILGARYEFTNRSAVP
jgi:hypothetical protein